MHYTALANELQQLEFVLVWTGRQWLATSGGNTYVRTRMHQRLQRSGHEAVIDEKVFLDAEGCIAAFEIAGMIILHAMAKDEILRASWGADGIGLDEGHTVEGAL
jgi:hypothetical protein